MKKQLFAFACCNLLLVFASCGDADTTPSPADSTAKMAAQEPVDQTERLIGGSLDTLWVDSLSFDNLPKKKLVLQYYFGNMDTLTLHGWSAKTVNDFNSSPNIKFTQGSKSSFSYGPGTYFGDLVLKKDDVRDIKKVLTRTKSQYVLLVPQTTGGHISYSIFVGKENLSLTTERSFTTSPTGLIANPSPPRSFD